MSTSGPFGSTPGEPDPDDPFGGMGFLFQDLSRLFSGGRRELGHRGAARRLDRDRGPGPKVNVDPVDRLAIEQLARVAELQVQEVTGLNIDEPVRLEALNRTQWARRFLDDERPLLEELSDSIGIALQAQLGQVEDDLAEDPDALTGLAGLPGMSPEALIRQVMSMMGPMLLGMMAGSTAGHLAVRAMGHFELPLPRPEGEPLTMVLANVDSFAEEWSLPKRQHPAVGVPVRRGPRPDPRDSPRASPDHRPPRPVRLELQLRPRRHGATDAGARGPRAARGG